MNRLVPLMLLGLTACVTARPDRSLDPIGDQLPSAAAVSLAVAQGVAALPAEPMSERMTRFLAESAQVREASTLQDAMPPVQQVRWKQLLQSVTAWKAQSRDAAAGADGASVRDQLLEALAADAGSYGSLPEGFLDEARAATVGLGAAKAAPKQVASSKRRRVAPNLTWPIENVRVTSGFGTRRHPIFKKRKHHKGVDFQARKGDRVLSAGTGKVIVARRHRSYGLRVEVDHGDGIVTSYSHLSSMLVKRGDEVKPGDDIGLAGRTGRATGVHLHFEVMIDGRDVNPLKFLGPVPTATDAADVKS